VALPPRHLKTFLASVCLAAWILAHDPSARILIVSYGQELADKIAYDIRTILQSEWFRRLFRTRINRAKLNDLVTTDGGGVRSVSVEGGVTGLGADFIIVDDPVQIKDCENIRQLERINDLFDSEVRTRLNHPNRGGIVIVAHRLAEDDLAGHVLRQGGWKEVRLPLVAKRRRTYDTGDGFIWHRKRGELLRPDAFSQRDVERLRKMKRPDFETLQQQNTGGCDRLRIKPEYFGRFSVNSVPGDRPVVVSIDPGQKAGADNSFSVIQAWAIHGGRYLLLEQWRAQARYPDFRFEARRIVRRYRPSAVLIEGTGQGPALSAEITPRRGMEVLLITPVEDKVSRLRKHRRLLRSGVLQLPQEAPWASEFLAEATLFPYSAFDDQVDCMSQFLGWIETHPNLQKRPPRALIAGVNSQGMPLGAPPGWTPAMECPGSVLARRMSIWRR
jgi:predicted phage terminase large subunit-like protein